MPPPTSTPIAKLTRPRAEGIHSRQRLLAELNGTRRPVIWIQGPPGAGKTSLTVDWLDRAGASYVWYQVDAADGSADTLFHYLSLGAQALSPRTGRRSALPKFDDDGPAGIDAFARRYFRDFFALLAPGAVLVFDNFQDAQPTETLHQLLRCAAEELPAGLRIVVLSRNAPPPALSRLRAEQRVHLLSGPALRFSEEECGALVRARMPAATAAAAARIHRQTGGWAGGLILTLEHLQRHGALDDPAEALDIEGLFDYFATQVLEHAGERATQLLLRMSFMPYLTAAQARVIAGSDEAVAILDEWSKRHLFIDARGGRSHSHHFHALFRAFLQQRARTHLSQAVQDKLSRIAGRLLEAAGDVDAAVGCYAQAHAYGHIAAAIQRHAPALFREGRRSILKTWLEALPRRLRSDNPWLQYWEAIAALGSAPATVRGLLDSAFMAFAQRDDRHGQLLAAGAAADSFFSDPTSWRGVDPWIERLDALLQGYSACGDAARARAIMSLTRAVLYRLPGDTRLDALAQGLERIVDGNYDPDVRVACGGVLLAYYFWRGHGHAECEVHRRLEQALTAEEVARPTLLYYLFWRALAPCKTGDQGAVARVVRDARAFTDDTGLAPLTVELERFIACALLVRGDATQARAVMLERLAPSLSQSRPVARAWYHNTLAACDLAEGNLDEASRHMAQSLDLARQADNALAELLSMPLAALIALHRGEHALAEATLAALTMRACNPRSEFEAAALRAYGSLMDKADVTDVAIGELVDAVLRQDCLPVYGWSPGLTNSLLGRAAAVPHLCGKVAQIASRFQLQCPPDEPDWWPRALRVVTLGTFHIEGVEASVKARTKPPRRLLELLQMIVAAGPEGASAESVADQLWPESDGDSARKSLEIALYRLRQLLGRPEAVVTRNGHVCLDARLCSVDAWRFDTRARHLLETRAMHDWVTAAEAALRLYTGHFLESGAGAWVLAARSRLRRRWRDLVAALYAAHVAARRWQDAATLIEHTLEIEPQDEAGYRMDLNRRIGSSNP